MTITKTNSTALYTENVPLTTNNRKEIYDLTLSWLKFCQTQLPSMPPSPKKTALDACRIVSLVVCDRITQNDLRFFSVISFDSSLDIRGMGFVKPLELPRPESGKRTPKHRTTRKFLHLNFLSANPCDVFSGVSLGAGSSIINAIFDKCIQDNYEGVFVEPVASLDFFTKRGFVDVTLAGVETGVETESDKRAMVWISSVFKAIPRTVLPAAKKDPKLINLSGYLTLAYKLTKPERKTLLSTLSNFVTDTTYLQVIEKFVSTSKEAFRNRKTRLEDLEHACISSTGEDMCIPLFHKLICENSVVRITACEMAPNDTIPLHTYPKDHIVIILQGSQLQFQDANGTRIEEREMTVQFIPGSETPCSCTNIGLKTYKALVFEFHAPASKDTVVD